MYLDKQKKYYFIRIIKKTDFLTLIDFLNSSESRNKNLIIDFLNCNIDPEMIVKKLHPFHFIWKKTNNSFILVSNIHKNLVEDLISIPTIEEALDFFHMEEMIRSI